MHAKTNVILGLGGNKGDRKANFSLVDQLISNEVGRIVARSPVYETEPWGFYAEENFWNQVLVVQTNLGAGDVLKTVLDIEARMGRMRVGEGYASRPMDIDILLYGEEVINEPDLIVPHPLMTERNFVVFPLADICPELVHPVYKKTICELKESCPDQGRIRIVKLD